MRGSTVHGRFTKQPCYIFGLTDARFDTSPGFKRNHHRLHYREIFIDKQGTVLEG